MAQRPALLLLLALGACAPPPLPPPAHPPAGSVLQAVGDRYADLQWLADSVVAAEQPAVGDPSEEAQTAARTLARRIALVRGDFEAVTVSMTTEQLDRALPLWMRLAISQAALEMLHQDAARLAQDPAASPAEVHDLAVQLSGSLELGRVTSRLAASSVDHLGERGLDQRPLRLLPRR
jgi:hypothetical protein